MARARGLVHRNHLAELTRWAVEHHGFQVAEAGPGELLRLVAPGAAQPPLVFRAMRKAQHITMNRPAERLARAWLAQRAG